MHRNRFKFVTGKRNTGNSQFYYRLINIGVTTLTPETHLVKGRTIRIFEYDVF